MVAVSYTHLDVYKRQKLFNSDKTTYRGEVCTDPYIHAYRFIVLTGLRPGELLGLRWSDIAGRVIKLQRAVNIYGEVTQGKNRNAVRALAVSTMALRELEQQKELTESQSSVFGISNQALLCDYWHRYIAYNHIAPCSLYELRHTFVSVAKKLPEGMVKSLVGHSENMDTFGTYGHALDGEASEVAAAIDKIFSGILASK